MNYLYEEPKIRLALFESSLSSSDLIFKYAVESINRVMKHKS